MAYSVCFGRQVAVGVLGKLIGKNQQAVERRAQLVRHVGEEFGFVFRREGQLLGLFLQRLPGLLDFGVLLLDFDVLMRQQPGLFLELIVGLLQFFLPALQFLGQRLRLREQILGAHVGFDRVEHDADAFGQLIEKRLVRRVEPLERGQFQDRLHLPFEHDRQHDDVHRRGAAEAGRNAHIFRRHVGQQDLFLFQGALADQSLAERDLLADFGRLFAGVAGQQRQAMRFAAAVVGVEDGALGRRPPGPVRRESAGRPSADLSAPATCG